MPPNTIQSGSIGGLYTVLSGDPCPILLLGAGASLRSGIPLAGGMVEKAARWAYARANGRSPDDPRIQRSDWWPWLTGHDWYNAQAIVADNYAAAVDHLLHPRQARKDFFQKLLQTDVAPSVGYEKLAEFMHHRLLPTVLTTNFDGLLPEVRVLKRRPHFIEVIQTKSDYTKFSTSPKNPQLVYLHGSVDHYTDKNILEEVQQLDEPLVEMLVPLLRDHPLVVVGYRGAEASVMKHLLLKNVEAGNSYRHGIYWCQLKSEQAGDLPPMVTDLATAIGANFTLTPIDGFDELFARDLWNLHQDKQLKHPFVAGKDQGDASVSPTLDMSEVQVEGLDDVDWPTLRVRLIQYCEALEVRVPSSVDRAWLTDQLLQANLAVRDSKGKTRLTHAGLLLFAQHPQKQISSAQVVVRAVGGADWIEKLTPSKGIRAAQSDGVNSVERTIDGNLWTQYEGINDVLGLFNRPFRLKGPVSETVLPYPPLALKELVVNALVHRDYGVDAPILIEIGPSSIRISNAGGLVDEVFRRVETNSIETDIRRGRRGLKGYRNPVLADLFYGSGEMDKAGSGLADVYRAIRDNGGEVRFGPTDGNRAFEVVVTARPEVIDEVTGTAAPTVLTTTTYAANLLEVQELPRHVFHAGTEVRHPSEIWHALPSQWIPPYLLHDERIYSFYDFDDPANPLHAVIDGGDSEPLSIEEFSEGPDGERRLVRLLNLCLQKHFFARGLIVDMKRKRAYFPRSEVGARSISYQARLRRATRTVVKARTSSHTGKVSYWEHEALRFKFEKFGTAWGLLLEPGYVFTFDGKKGLLAPERVNRLSTRRAARDYNAAVHNDLSFWAWLLADGRMGGFSLETGPRSETDSAISNPQIVLAGTMPTISVADLALVSGDGEPEFDTHDEVELEAELEQIAQEQREESEVSESPEDVH